MKKPWDDEEGMFGKLYKIKILCGEDIRINGRKTKVDSWRLSKDSLTIEDGNKVVRFHRAELDWLGDTAPRKCRGKWAVSSCSTIYSNSQFNKKRMSPVILGAVDFR